MNQLALLLEPGLPATLGDDLATAKAFAEQALAPSTRKGYRSDFAIFRAWCRQRGVSNLPASPETVAAFLAHQAQDGVKTSTLGCRCAAIAYAHELAGLETPTSAKHVRVTLAGIRRSVGVAPRRVAAATADVIADMIRHCDDSLRGRRDAALVALGFAAALRRSELVALQVDDLVEVEAGYRLMIRRSKTDQEGQGASIAVPHGRRLRPVAAVRGWLDAAQITEGPVFRAVLKGSRVQPEALTDRSVAEIIKRLAAAAGYDPAQFSGHSLRSGFLTSAAANRASLWKMQAVSRHKSIDVLSGYVRDAEAFDDHAGDAFL